MFSRNRRSVSVSEIAETLGLHKSNASRIAASLARTQYLVAVEGERGKYQLGWRFVELGNIAMGNSDLLSAAGGPLAMLAQECGDTSHMGVADGLEAVTIAVVDGWRAIRMHSYVGKRSPAYSSAMGKVLLAGANEEDIDKLLGQASFQPHTPNTLDSPAQLRRQLPKIRQRGYATDLEELEEGMCCVAAPVFDYHGHVIASVSVSGPTSRVYPDTVPDLAERVIATAQQVSRALGAPFSVEGWSQRPAPATSAVG